MTSDNKLSREQAVPLKPQPGDIVHVRACVTRIDGNTGNILATFNNAENEANQLWIGRHDLLAIEPRPLKVGDTVKWKLHQSEEYYISAMNLKWCWIFNGRSESGELAHIDDLEGLTADV